MTFNKPGYLEKTVVISSDLNGWYFGNLIFGGVIGLLIVDPATGAMYKLKTLDVNETLASGNAGSTGGDRSLEVYDLNKIPDEWKSRLIKLSK